MFKTFSAFKLLFVKSWSFYFILSLFISILFLCTFFVKTIETTIQDAVLNIVSILFPLIAGFLTFGREIIINLNKRIDSIKLTDKNQQGRPTPDLIRRKISRLKNLALNFKNIVISTFFNSFLLIIIVLIAKFNKFEFKTEFFNSHCLNFSSFIKLHWITFVLKLIFLSTILILFLNLSYLVYFIIQVNKEDELIDNIS